MSEGPTLPGAIDLENSIGILDVDQLDSGALNLHEKADASKITTDAILQDTAAMEPKLGIPANGTISQDVADIKTVADSTATDVSTIEGVVTDPASGNAALLTEINANETKINDLDSDLIITTGKVDDVKTVVDANGVKSTNIINLLGTFDTGTAGGALSAISDNLAAIADGQGRFQIAAPAILEVPDTGDKWYPYKVMHKVGGIDTDLDSAPVMDLVDADGNSYNGILYDQDKITVTTSPTKISAGVYLGFIKLPSSQQLEPLSFSSTGLYNTDSISQNVQMEVQEFANDAFKTTDRATIDAILIDTADIQPRLINVENDVAIVQTTVDTINGKADIIDNNVDSIVSDMVLIKNKDVNATFDQSTDSLEALSDKLTTVLANISSSNPKMIEAVKNSGGIAAGASELVALGTVDGFTSIKAMIYVLKVELVSGDASKILVTMYKDGGTSLLAYKANRGRKIRTSEGLSEMIQIPFSNKDVVPNPACYVKIEVTDGGANPSIFKVTVEGHELS